MTQVPTSGSATSSIPVPSSASSAQVSPAAATASSLVMSSPTSAGEAPSRLHEMLEKWGLPLAGMALTAVISYFMAIMQLKDGIASNDKSISTTQAEVSSIKDRVDKVEEKVEVLSDLKIDVAVIKSEINRNADPAK